MKLTYKKQVLEMLQNIPLSRERKNREKSIWHILFHGDINAEINREDFIRLFPHIQSINRLITWHQEHNPELRGSDYSDKQKLEEETMLDLGYQPGHNYYNKKLNEQL